MKYKLKCLLHDKISFGAVGPNSVCLDCDCGNMIYCQNEKQKQLQQLIESRIKFRREIKRIEQQKYDLNQQSKRLKYQYESQEDTSDLSLKSIESKQYLDDQLTNNQNKQQTQISKQQDLNNQLLLDEFENLCKQELEEITNAEFIFYHMNTRKKWQIINPVQIEQALLQSIDYYVENQYYQCRVVGNRLVENEPLNGYYILFIHSIIYDGYWKNGQLMDGTCTYLEGLGFFKSYSAQQLINKNETFQFKNICKFYHSFDDHNRYYQIHKQQLQGLKQCNNPNHYHQKCNHSHHNQHQ